MNARGLEDLRKCAFHHLAVFEHVRHTRRAAKVVFEDVKLPVSIANEVRADDVAPDPLRRFETDTRAEKTFRGLDDFARDRSITQYPLFVINVVDEAVQRENPLFQPAFDPFPLS